MKVKSFGKVAVMLGGRSAEREISLMSGNAVLVALKRKGVDAHAFDTRDHDLHELRSQGFDRVFIALHGRYGEDGTVQGALELMGIPYTGSGVLASSLAMDKWRTKLVWIAAGIPTPRFVMLEAGSDFKAVSNDLGLPLIVKPSREGSTIGLTKVIRAEDLEAAYRRAREHDDMVLAEEFIAGTEVTASILGEQVLPLIRIEAPGGNYDYPAKYFSDETRYFCPSGLPPAQESRIRVLALKASRILDCRGWGRVDVMLNAKGEPSLLEANTVPGMTGHSLVPMAAKAAGIPFDDLVVRILE
ncbi:MAG TPA: D-alanine--D-alanine ligase, partial [Burkholderiales bacterium]|nr:D-alanine--D-alanine ligase [Burkholderiales bacterium]